MEVFPLFLVRIGGLNYELLDDLKYHDFHIDVRICTALEIEKQSKKHSLCEHLYDEIKSTTDEKVRKNLINLKRDVYNDRLNFAVADRYSDLLKGKNISIAFDAYANLHQAISDGRKKCELKYTNALGQSRESIRQMAANDVLRNGILLSSDLLLDSIDEYLSAGVSNPGKRELHTELSLYKYISRICAKTSPNSTFTALSIGHIRSMAGILTTTIDPGIAERSVSRMNGYILKYYRALLQNDSEIKRYLKIRLNPITVIERDQFLFLTTHNKTDVFQRIKRNPVLDLMYDFMRKEVPAEMHVIVSTLATHIDSPEPEIYAYLSNLISVGFMEFDVNTTVMHDTWSADFLQELYALKDQCAHPLLDPMIDVLRRITGFVDNYPTLQSPERRQGLKDIHQRFRDLSASAYTRDPDGAAIENTRAFRKVYSTKFQLQRKNLLYEDVSTGKTLNLNKQEVDLIISKLDKLSEKVKMVLSATPKRHMADFFRKTYPAGEAVPFISFYEHYFKSKAKKKTGGNGNDKGQLPAPADIARYFDRCFECSQTDEGVNFSLKAEEPGNHVADNSERHCSLGVLAQPYIDKANSLHFVLNINTVGYGKLMSRFLHLFDPSILASVRAWNLKFEKNIRNIENNDETYFNANIHPPLLSSEVFTPGSSLKSRYPNAVSISDLNVRYNGTLDLLELFNGRNGEVYNVIDLGFEGRMGRSRLFQLLNHFNYYDALNFKSFNAFISNRFSASSNGVTVRPRISFESCVIMQRKTWIVDKDHLPLKGKAESDFNYFVRINDWRIAHNMPEEVYVCIAERSVSFAQGKNKEKPVAADDGKPQYINFISPVSVRLLEKLLRKVSRVLKVEEMKPTSEELLTYDGQRFVTELWIQWHKNT